MSDDDNGPSKGFIGVLIFIAIFVVINIVLYFTTGWVIIPIKK